MLIIFFEYNEFKFTQIGSVIKRYHKHLLSAVLLCFQIKTGYHETITVFYSFVIAEALQNTSNLDGTFEYFLKQNGHLLDRSLMYKYYSRDRFSLPEAKHTYEDL